MNKEESAYLDALDISYSYNLAKRMEQFKTNPALGYRTAGSRAEYDTGNMLAEEMRAIGLEDVAKDAVNLDSWEFQKAVLRFRTLDGSPVECQLGAYQTNFDTHGSKEYPVVYAGRGTAADYSGLDVRGKLVLVDINQRDEWWINFPVYQAYKMGAAALIAVQEGGYGEIHDEALNAQDIAGPAEAAAFSMSRADARKLKQVLREHGEATAEFEARTVVKRNQTSYNIVGKIPGKNPERMIVLSAHYDSYFSGFQDDNAAVAMIFGIARALLRSGYHPQNTLVFCAVAAEEWGITNSKYDWSTGAYEQVFTAHPEWQGRVIADLNFELPAHAHGSRDAIRCVYEYKDFIHRWLEENIRVEPEIYPGGIQVLCPVETWSDDFSFAISGIPSMVNDFSAGPFMETHYHSQFDNESFYQEPVYAFHHRLYGRLVMAFDRTAAAPLNFTGLFEAMENSLDMEYSGRHTKARGERLLEAVGQVKSQCSAVYRQVEVLNQTYAALLEEGRDSEARKLQNGVQGLERELLSIFREAQDSFVRLNWHDEVLFPQEAVRTNLSRVEDALACLRAGYAKGALEAIYGIDNNRYAFLFDEEVFTYFTEYVLEQPRDRLKWGAGRIVHHENLFHLVQQLKEKLAAGSRDFSREIQVLTRVEASQLACYCDDIEYMIREVHKIQERLGESSLLWKATDCTGCKEKMWKD